MRKHETMTCYSVLQQYAIAQKHDLFDDALFVFFSFDLIQV